MSVKEERVWAGSTASYELALDAETKIVAGAFDKEDEDEDEPRLLSVEDGLATITIKGPLVNRDSPYLQLFGVTGYPEIREALVAALNNADVKQILLDVDSGGGAVSGCADTGMLIRSANKIKPVTAYGDTMASAAYWLACSASRVYCGKAALVGSIGVKATFREYSKQNEMEGVTVTVIRSGKYKALADQNEPLSKEGKAQIQALCDASYGVFVDHVAEMRGKTYEYADKTMADGQEFIGQASVDVGLADGVTTFDAVVGGLKKKIVASLSKTNDNGGSNRFSLSGNAAPITSGEAPMGKKALTEADIVALAAGASLDAEVHQEANLESQEDGVQAQEGNKTEEVTEEVTDEVATTTTSQVATTDATVQLLTSQIKDKDEALLQANIKLAKLQDFKDQYEASIQPLKDIVARSANIMHISLGGHERAFAEMQPADLVVEHARLSKEFSKFPVGGVAAVSAKDAPAKTQIDPRQKARVNAVRFQK